jgi:hypothetical protein
LEASTLGQQRGNNVVDYAISATRETVNRWRMTQGWGAGRDLSKWQTKFAEQSWLTSIQCQDLVEDIVGYYNGPDAGSSFITALIGVEPEPCFPNPVNGTKALGVRGHRVDTVAYALIVAKQLGLNVKLDTLLLACVARIKTQRYIGSYELAVLRASHGIREAEAAYFTWLDNTGFPNSAEFLRLRCRRVAVAFRRPDGACVEVILPDISRLSTKTKVDLFRSGFREIPAFRRWLEREGMPVVVSSCRAGISPAGKRS